MTMIARLNNYTEYSFTPVLFFEGIVYIMGGSGDPDDSGAISYEVMTVNLKTGDVGQVEDTSYGINAPVAASSLNRIALCGGSVFGCTRNYCQVFSPQHNRCTFCMMNRLVLKNNGHCQVTGSSRQWLKTKTFHR